MKKYKKGKIATIILDVLLAVGFITVALAAPNAVQIFKRFHPKNARERERIKQSLAKLERAGFIVRKNRMDGYFVLTSKGEMRAKREKIENTRIARPKKWDGLWRLIMFDVPEEKRKERQAINFALKKIGCAQYQKSVFITPFPCEEEIDFVANCFGVRQYVRVILAQKVEDDVALRKMFNL